MLRLDRPRLATLRLDEGWNAVEWSERWTKRKGVQMPLSRRTLWIGGALAVLAAVIIVVALYSGGGGGGYGY